MTEPTGLILSAITAVVGGIALFIYYQTHKDERTLAAQTIFSEISTAENKLNGIRTRFFKTEQPILESNVIMRYESWSRYKSLFLKDLNSDEWNQVDGFYNNCLDYDSAVGVNKKNIRLLIKENYRHQYDYYSQVIIDAHVKNPDMTELPEDKLSLLLNYQRLFLSDKSKNTFDYIPRQGVAEARTALVALDSSVTASSAGQKLKRIAKL